MTYKYNGVALTAQPTKGNWMAPASLGDDGDGRPIYPFIFTFELVWNGIAPSDFKQLVDQWTAISVSGTVVMTLPQWGASTYTFFDYTGTIPQMPTSGEYFEGFILNAKQVISNVRV
jgi:hypothetical protein